jgi:hypothetical protein
MRQVTCLFDKIITEKVKNYATLKVFYHQLIKTACHAKTYFHFLLLLSGFLPDL